MTCLRFVIGGLFLVVLVVGSFAFRAPGPQDEAPSTSTSRIIGRPGWGMLWYIHGGSTYDEATGVEGGAEGSALLLIRTSPKTTDWVFLDGDYMWLRPRGEPATPVAHVPGEFVTSENYEWCNKDTYDHEKLSYYLINLKEADCKISHAPFLTGAGWPDGKAPVEEAKGILKAMEFKPLNDWPAVASYVDTQETKPGSASNTGIIRLSFKQYPGIPPKVVGDDFANPDSSLSGEGTHIVGAAVSSRHFNHAKPPNCGGDGPDYIWQVPAERTVRVSRLNPFKKIAISAWKGTGGNVFEEIPGSNAQRTCDFGRSPSLDFKTGSAGCTYYIVADLPASEWKHGIGWIDLRVELEK